MNYKSEPIFFDENKKNELLQPHQMSIDYFQNIVNNYNSLEIDELTENDLIQLIENPKKFIAERIVKDENLSFGNLKIKFESLYEMIEKPNGTDEFINQIQNDKSDRNKLTYHNSVQSLAIENGKKVIVSLNKIDQVNEQSKVYLKTKAESDIYDSLIEIAKQYDKLKKYQFKEKELKDLIFNGFIRIDFENNANVNPYFAKYIRE